MSDDDTVPAAPGQIVELHTDEVDSQSQDSGEPMQVFRNCPAFWHVVHTLSTSESGGGARSS